MAKSPVRIEKIVLESQMLYQGNPVLHYRIEYPQFYQLYQLNELGKVNQWYELSAKLRKSKNEDRLYWDAAEQYRYFSENQFPFHMYEAISVYEITYNEDDKISLYYDDYIYSGGAHGSTVRSSDTWSVTSGDRLPLSKFLKPNMTYQMIIEDINNQIANQISKGEKYYFDNYQQLVAEYFNPQNYYLTKDGIIIYYQQYEIAPYASGIPEFLITDGIVL